MNANIGIDATHHKICISNTQIRDAMAKTIFSIPLGFICEVLICLLPTIQYSLDKHKLSNP